MLPTQRLRESPINYRGNNMKKLSLRVLSVILFIGAVFILYQSFEETVKVYINNTQQDEQIHKFKANVTNKPVDSVDTDDTRVNPLDNDVSANLYTKSLDTIINDTELDRGNGPVLGVISITDDESRLKLPIYQGVGDESLYKGAGTNKKGQVMGEGNYTLASHYMYDGESLFAPLRRLTEGTYIYITDYTQVHVYQYRGVVNHDPSDVYVLDDTDERILTLYTCTNDWEMREVYRSDYIGYYNYQELSEQDKEQLNI